jgi:hypothetical protein
MSEITLGVNTENQMNIKEGIWGTVWGDVCIMVENRFYNNVMDNVSCNVWNAAKNIELNVWNNTSTNIRNNVKRQYRGMK